MDEGILEIVFDIFFLDLVIALIVKVDDVLVKAHDYAEFCDDVVFDELDLCLVGICTAEVFTKLIHLMLAGPTLVLLKISLK